MNLVAAIGIVLIASGFGVGSYGSALPQSPAAGDQPAKTLPLELAKSLDSRKLKQGDPVEAKMISQFRTEDGTLVPPGSKVMGHVTESSARAKGEPQSQLGITFDQIALKDGRKLPLKASIQAVGPPMNYGVSQMPMGGPSGGVGAPTGPMGGINPGNNPIGVGGGPGNPSSNFPNPAGSGNAPNSPQGDQPNSPQVTPQSSGVIGLGDLRLEQESVLVSNAKQVKLPAGSQILLRLQDQ
jgi:hypothetical protein